MHIFIYSGWFEGWSLFVFVLHQTIYDHFTVINPVAIKYIYYVYSKYDRSWVVNCGQKDQLNSLDKHKRNYRMEKEPHEQQTPARTKRNNVFGQSRLRNDCFASGFPIGIENALSATHARTARPVSAAA